MGWSASGKDRFKAFVFRKEIFKYIYDGEELVDEPFQRLIEQNELIAYKYDGFFGCMDTLKDKQQLEEMYAQGRAPWEVWRSNPEVAHFARELR